LDDNIEKQIDEEIDEDFINWYNVNIKGWHYIFFII
jgi:hypothetical protein